MNENHAVLLIQIRQEYEKEGNIEVISDSLCFIDVFFSETNDTTHKYEIYVFDDEMHVLKHSILFYTS